MTEPIVLCWSGGKDSMLSLDELRRQDRYEIAALVTTVTREYDRISMHGVRRSLLHRQAEALGLPLAEVFLAPAAPNAEYETQLGDCLRRFRAQGIRRVAFGDIFLEDLRDYRERLLARWDMECLFPIWRRDTRELAETFLQLGFRAVTTCIDPRVLDGRFVGREFDRTFLEELPANCDPCGENGEFHSFVYDGQLLSEPIEFTRGKTVLRDSFLYCDLVFEQPTIQSAAADGITIQTAVE